MNILPRFLTVQHQVDMGRKQDSVHALSVFWWCLWRIMMHVVCFLVKLCLVWGRNLIELCLSSQLVPRWHPILGIDPIPEDIPLAKRNKKTRVWHNITMFTLSTTSLTNFNQIQIWIIWSKHAVFLKKQYIFYTKSFLI